MTKTALANKELDLRRDIATKDRLSREEIAAKDRRSKEKMFSGKTAMDAAKGLGAIATRATGKLISAVNDPSWYKNYIADLDKFTNLPTYERLGASDYKGLYTMVGHRPGIAIIEYIDTVGPESGSTNDWIRSFAINQIANRTKEQVLKANSRSQVPYEGSDIIYNNFVSCSIITRIQEWGRAIQAYETYNGDNAYLAEALVTALGFDYSEMNTYIAEHRKQYLKCIKKFNESIVCPIGETVNLRKMHLSSQIFTDSSDVRKQMYAYVSMGVFKLTNDGSSVYFTPSDRSTYTKVRDEIDIAIDSLTKNPDFVEMYQDLRMAFDGKLVQLASMLDQPLIINADPANRAQFNNTRIAPLFHMTTSTVVAPELVVGAWDLHQNTDGDVYQGTGSTLPVNVPKWRTIRYTDSGLNWVTTGGAWTSQGSGSKDRYENYESRGVLLNMFKESVSGDDILDITRNIARFTNITPHYENDEGYVTLQVTDCGTEAMIAMKVYYFDSTSTLQNIHVSTYVAGEITHISEFLRIAYVSDFDWMPPMAYISRLPSTGNYVIGELGLAFAVTHLDLHEVHEACTLSEFFIPADNFKKFSGTR